MRLLLVLFRNQMRVAWVVSQEVADDAVAWYSNETRDAVFTVTVDKPASDFMRVPRADGNLAPGGTTLLRREDVLMLNVSASAE